MIGGHPRGRKHDGTWSAPPPDPGGIGTPPPNQREHASVLALGMPGVGNALNGSCVGQPVRSRLVDRSGEPRQLRERFGRLLVLTGIPVFGLSEPSSDCSCWGQRSEGIARQSMEQALRCNV